MGGRAGGGFGAAVAWLVFPVVPAALAVSCHRALNAHDPRLWEPSQWALLLGPLAGFGFLAGATVDLPDEPGRRGLGRLVGRRALWVAVGPWTGYLLSLGLIGLFWAWEWLVNHWPRTAPEPALNPDAERFRFWLQMLAIGLIWTCAYGWLPVALAAILRGRRRGRLGRSLKQGLTTALGFVGSLIGGFWAATALWRAYFFDKRIVPTLLVAALGLTLLSGCGAPETVGDVRRREFFEAMLMAWVLGLALLWRWRSRPRA